MNKVILPENILSTIHSNVFSLTSSILAFLVFTITSTRNPHTHKSTLYNLNRNNEVIQNGLEQIELFNKSSEIIISAINNKLPYSATLKVHFYAATRTGGIMFPVSMEGYETLKNVGFTISPTS